VHQRISKPKMITKIKILLCILLAWFGATILFQQYYIGLIFFLMGVILFFKKNIKPFWAATSALVFIILFAIFFYQTNLRFYKAHESIPGVPSKVLAN
jgi:hypothetical protein